MTRLPLACLALAAVLAGCTATSDSTPATVPVTQKARTGSKPVACAPREWTRLVGREVAQVRLPPGLEYRVMTRGAVIMDEYSEDRLNIITDKAGRVVEVSCG